MRADRRRIAAADPVADHLAAGGAWPDLRGDLRLHAFLERVHLRLGLHSIDREKDRAGGDPDRAGDRRRVPMGIADGGISAGLRAGGDNLFLLCGVLRLLNDRGGEGIGSVRQAGRSSLLPGAVRIQNVSTKSDARVNWPVFVPSLNGLVPFSDVS